MLGRIIFNILLVSSIFIEVTILPFPFFALFAILLFFFFEDTLTFITILFFSLLLDRLMINTLGVSAVFLFLFFLTVVLLERLFTFKINLFIAIIIAIAGVEIYRRLSGYPFLWGMEFLVVGALLLLVLIVRRIGKKEGGVSFAT